jgi:hypothetical protein
MSSIIGVIASGCVGIEDEGHHDEDHRHEQVGEVSILTTLFREVLEGVSCDVLGVVVNDLGLTEVNARADPS